MSDSILTRIDEMGGRIDELERSVGELIQQAGVDEKK
jgi:heat shock factor-binding protein 1